MLILTLQAMRAFVVVLGCFAHRSLGEEQDEVTVAALRSMLFARTFAVARSSSRVRPSFGQRNVVAYKHPVVMKENAMEVKDLMMDAGISAPLGFFDPFSFTIGQTEGRIRFYREVEVKHGRLGMLAALGFLVAENYHPLFGGDIDAPGYLAFQQTPLQTFWPAGITVIAILEVFSVFSFNTPAEGEAGGEPWSIRSDHIPGDLGFDPLNLKPTDAEELKTMHTKELNNGRLAMLAAAGMIAQEVATGQKLF